MIPKPTHKERLTGSTRPMVSRLIKFTPNCDYAEVQIVSHTGSWHKEGDIILISREEYEKGREVRPIDMTPFVPKETIEKFLKATPTKEPRHAHPGRKSKNQSQKAAR